MVLTQDSISYRLSAPTSAKLPAAAAVHLNEILAPHVHIEPGQIVVANSPTALGNMLGYNLAERGDGILVNRPVYGRFELDYGVEAGVKMVYADTDTEEAFTPASVEKYELALKDAEEHGTKIRAVLLVNPHNPVGECSSWITLGGMELTGQVVATRLRPSKPLRSFVTETPFTSSVMRFTLPAFLIRTILMPCHSLPSCRLTCRI